MWGESPLSVLSPPAYIERNHPENDMNKTRAKLSHLSAAILGTLVLFTAGPGSSIPIDESTVGGQAGRNWPLQTAVVTPVFPAVTASAYSSAHPATPATLPEPHILLLFGTGLMLVSVVAGRRPAGS